MKNRHTLCISEGIWKPKEKIFVLNLGSPGRPKIGLCLVFFFFLYEGFSIKPAAVTCRNLLLSFPKLSWDIVEYHYVLKQMQHCVPWTFFPR